MIEIQTKICSKCKEEKTLEYFHKGNGSFNTRAQCKECCKNFETPERKQKRIEAEKIRRQSPDYKARQNELERIRKKSNVESTLLINARARAKKKGIEFNIDISDIIIPTLCPLLEIPLTSEYGIASSNSYSLDRKDNSKGYIKGNVWVISKKANALKGDASLEELELLITNLKKHWIH